MKKMLMLLMLGVAITARAELEVSDVQVFSGKPWREVAIGYTIAGTTSEPRSLRVKARDNTTGMTYDCATLTGASVEPGRHIMKWDAQADDVKISASNVVITVQVLEPLPLYYVVDLSGGVSTKSYPVSKLSCMPSSGWTDEYKTEKLVLRRVDPGVFKMQNQYDVTLSKYFYMGVFEVTQRQWELVLGNRPSYCTNDTYYAFRPVENVSYGMIRGASEGAKWPVSNSVDAASFLGKLREKTRLVFDLPTEAQWEYACRAGTTTDYNNGTNASARYGDGYNEDVNMNVLGRYWCNGGGLNKISNILPGPQCATNYGSAKVGSYQPNAWGFYDMHGNVSEWCLDWRGKIGTSTDPKGAVSGLDRIQRGGSWTCSYATSCTSSYRTGSAPSGATSVGIGYGFRLCWTLQTGGVLIEANDNEVVLSESSSIAVPLDVTVEDGSETSNRFEVAYGNLGAELCRVEVDGALIVESDGCGKVNWWTAEDGLHAFVWLSSGCAMTTTVNVVELIGPISPVVLPVHGTIFDSGLTVTMSCPMDDTSIYYTLDGSEPTIESKPYKKFKISGKTIVKAVAYRDGYYSDVVTCEYAPGRCADPVVFPRDGTVFKHSGQIVRIKQDGEEGVLRYTTDGTDPTAESPAYEGPLMVDDSIIVKAKVFSDRYFDSAVVTVNLTREWEVVATPVITAAEEFTGSEAKVVITTATPGATIRYTTDGSEPNSRSPLYAGPFWVNASCTVKAVAMCADYLTSEVVSKTITKVWGIGDTMGAPDHAFTTSGDADFFRVDDETAPNKEAMRSGAIGDSAGYGLYSWSVLSSTVQGPCTIKFKWRSSCEQDDDYEWDHAEFAVDGVVVARINDVTEWREVSHDITDGGSHVITWSYLKDDSEKEGEDCLWVADYSWTPAELYTHESSVPVPYDWILSYLPHTPNEYDRFEAAVRETAANGMNTVEEAYIAGLDPSKESSKFIAIITMDENVPTITWSPDLSDDDLPRHYTIYGKRALDGIEDWEIVTDANKPNMRFFKVTVNMP